MTRLDSTQPYLIRLIDNTREGTPICGYLVETNGGLPSVSINVKRSVKQGRFFKNADIFLN